MQGHASRSGIHEGQSGVDAVWMLLGAGIDAVLIARRAQHAALHERYTVGIRCARLALGQAVALHAGIAGRIGKLNRARAGAQPALRGAVLWNTPTGTRERQRVDDSVGVLLRAGRDARLIVGWTQQRARNQRYALGIRSASLAQRKTLAIDALIAGCDPGRHGALVRTTRGTRCSASRGTAG